MQSTYKKPAGRPRKTFDQYIKQSGVPSKGLTLQQWAMHSRIRKEFGSKNV